MTTDLEARVRATYAAKVSQVPAAAARDDGAVLTHVTPRRPSRRRLAVAAAVVAVVAVGTAGAIAVARDHTGQRVATRPTHRPNRSAAVPSASGLAPTTIPPDVHLVDVVDRYADGATGFEPTQLFGRLDTTGAPSPGVLLRMQPSTGGTSVGDPLTVRGVAGVSATPKEAVGASVRISWTEGDAAIDAVVRGMSQADAIAFLDALRPRGASPLQGFDATTLPLLGEQLTAPAAGRNLTYQYDTAAGRAPADPPALEIVTQPNASYPGYLGLWIQGSRQADGSVTVRDPGWGLDLAWPDGRQILVNSRTDDWARLEAVARGVHKVSGARIDELSRRSATDRPRRRPADAPANGSGHLGSRPGGRAA